MKKGLSLLISALAFNLSFGQQDKQFTHYMFDKMSFNPATTGFKGYCGTVIYRNQWDRVQDAPNTTLLNLQGNIPGTNFGAGISMTNDVIGFQKNRTLTVNGAYHLRRNAGTLSGGLGLGFINVAFDPDWQPPQTLNDPLLPDATSSTAFDVNLGLHWHGTAHPYYVGVSMTHLAPTTLKNINYTLARHYYVLAGYDFTLKATKRVIKLKPSVLLKADGATMVFDVNVLGEYWINHHSFLTGGMSYRLSDAIALNIGYAFSPKSNAKVNMMKIGYSFDIMTNPLNTYGKGSHELMLNFCMFPPPPPVARHGNPFFLD